MKFFIIFMISAILSVNAESEFTLDFSSDGCTDSPNGNWVHCCVEHDITYWRGGSSSERRLADNRLRQCMNKSGGPGHIYYMAVQPAGFEYWASAWEGNNFDGKSLTNEDWDKIELEYELWLLIGRPYYFLFDVLESYTHIALTAGQKVRLDKEFEKYKVTNEYAVFRRDYISATGEKPLY
jgi:hypothetical protein